jgi:PAS domain S-box-containing protein
LSILRRKRLAWKLSVPVLAVVAAAILGAGYLGSVLSRRVALTAARNVMQFNSTSIRSGIGELMMTGNRDRALWFIEEMAQESATYEDIALVSHPSGRVNVSRLRPVGSFLDKTSESCIDCHPADGPATIVVERHDEVVTMATGERALHVVTPIFNRTGCRSAHCHQHADDGQVLGFLYTEYSLASFDDMMTGLDLLLSLAAALAMILAVAALMLMFRSMLAKPLRRLVAGLASVAEGDLAFRFSSLHDDEIGMVESSFNAMADQLERHERDLQRANEYLEGIVENTADALVTVNPDGTIKTFNTGAERMLGYDRREAVGTMVARMFADPEDRDTAVALLREQENVTNWETQFRTKDGEVRDVLLTLSRLRNRRGHVIGHLGISKDVTLEKDLQKRLVQSEQAAAIGRAVTAIQHAVKNMLNTLKGGLYVVRLGQKKDMPERIQEGVEMISEGLERISDLSLNMLKYAREWKIEPEAVDLREMARKVTMAVAESARERGISVRTEIDESLPMVRCDPRLIHMGLMDIVSNALDACEVKDYEGGEVPEIVIRAYQTAFGTSVVVEVEDNGAGMTQEVIDNVFTPFFSTKKKWGTGLGLALTARVIDLHGGEIAVESEPDHGAVFRVTLPLVKQRLDQGVAG